MTNAPNIVPDWETARGALIKDGITTAPVLYAEEADYLRQAYIEGCVPPLITERTGTTAVNADRAAATGSFSWKYISLTDPVLNRILLNEDLLEVIQAYYGEQPYLRRMPFVKQSAVLPHHTSDIAWAYHIDQGRHFVGIMLLLSDLTEQDTHMRFLVGTHKLGHTSFRLRSDDPNLRQAEEKLEQDYPVFKLIGPKGTMFIYDNGCGIHKGTVAYGSVRNVMQGTYSRGDHDTKPADMEVLPAALLTTLAGRAPIVREAVRKIV